MKINKMKSLVLTAVVLASLAGCSTQTATTTAAATTAPTTSTETVTVTNSETSESESTSSTDTVIQSLSDPTASALNTEGMFSERDVTQTADLSGAVYTTVTDGSDVNIYDEGVYVISGSAKDVTITVDAGDDAKVQIVLDGLTVSNTDAPVIFVKSADKVFVTTTSETSTLAVTGTFSAIEDEEVNAVIYSKSDLTLNGVGILSLQSETGNGVTAKDDLKITGGAYVVSAANDGFKANDSIRIYDGDITVNAQVDALHSENSDDASLGYIYIYGGTLNISAGDDGIRGNSVVQVDGGDITISSATEGIEANYIQFNGGTLDLYATDDGINAANKVGLTVAIVVNDGTLNVEVGSGDTDAFDANGSIYINGGTINVTAQSAFDSDLTAELNGGTVTVNGEVITEISESQMGPGGGGKGGGMGGGPGKGTKQ